MENPSYKQMVINAIIGMIGFVAVLSTMLVMFVPLAIHIAGKLYGVEVDLF